MTYETNHQFNIDISQKTLFADFNNDEFVDILAYGTDSVVTIYLNNQLGEFSSDSKVLLNIIENSSLLVGDVNNDSKVDIILSDKSILQNQGDMEFLKVEDSTLFDSSSTVYNPDDNGYFPIKLTKYNEDEFPDLIIRKNNQSISSDSYVLFNDGNGNFGYSETLTTRPVTNMEFAGMPLIADFNNDGFDDYIVSSYYNSGRILDFSVNSISDPVVSMNTILSITNPLSGYDGSLANNRITNYSYLPFDINGDGKNEYLSIYSYSQFNSKIRLPYAIELIQNSGSTLVGDSLGFNAHYLSNITAGGFEVKSLALFENKLMNYQSFIKGDLNNDGLEDLLVNYTDCQNQCGAPKSRVFYNSDSGLNLENTEDFSLGYISSASIVDFDGNGTNEIVQLYEEGELPDTIQKIQIIEFGDSVNNVIFHEINIDGIGTEFSINDINNDGIADIIFLNNNKRPSAIYGNSNIATLGDQVELVSKSAMDYRLLDFDGDDDFDLYISTNELEKIYRYENVVNGKFRNVESFDFPEEAYLNKMTFSDIKGDGDLEIVYLPDFPSNRFNIYKYDYRYQYELIFSHTASGYDFYSPLSLVDDFDNDGQFEILFDETIFYIREFKFATGLLYDSEHSGHGFSLESVGEEQFFTVFYTYDNDGYPEWYTDLGMFEATREDYWNIASNDTGLIRNEYDYASQIVVQNTDNQYKGLVQHKICSDSYGKISLDFEIGVGNFGLPLSSGAWCSKPIVDYLQRPFENDFSGLWWAGGDDSGWGWSISLVERDNSTDMVLVLYYYDALGNPRWLIGQQQGFVKGQEIILDMNRVNGYGRSYTPVDLTFVPAGTITLTLNQVSNDLSKAGVMSIDVTYPGPEGGNWVRDHIPIALFSNPRSK